LQDIKFKFNPPDQIFYLPTNNHLGEKVVSNQMVVRRLIKGQDDETFKQMESECTEDDLESGFVELDQEFVYGAFLNNKLIAFAGAYAHIDPIYDIGVVTHPEFRRMGAGSAVVTSLCNELMNQGKIPQYRVQPQLIGSVLIAKSLGFVKILEWQYEFQA
jgi:predicted GNAT family acetyltransferase